MLSRSINPAFIMKSLSLLVSFLPLAFSHIAPRGNDGRCPYHQPDPDRLVPNRYLVLFHDSHTLDDHLSNTGLNLQQDPNYAFSSVRLINGYHATLNESILHDVVRFDPGVKLVEHTTFSPPLDDPIDGEDSFQHEEPKKNLRKRWKEMTGKRRWFLKMLNSGRRQGLNVNVNEQDVSNQFIIICVFLLGALIANFGSIRRTSPKEQTKMIR